MVILLIAIIAFIAFAAILEDNLVKYKWQIYIFLGVVFIMTAAFRVVGNDNDSQTYEYYFLHYDEPLTALAVEFSFIIISFFVNKFTTDVHWLFFIYAVLGVTLKFLAIKKLSKFLFLSLFIYVCHFFVLHDMIQMRVSVSTALLLLAIKPLSEGRRRTALLLMATAAFFHYSSLAMLAVLLFNNKPLSNKMLWFMAAIIPVGYAAFLMNIDLVTTVPIPYIGEKIEMYKQLKDMGRYDELAIFNNPIVLIRIFMFYLLLAFHDTIYNYNKEFPLMMKIEALLFICFFMLSSLPVLAGRLSELFSVVDIILYTNVVYIFRPQYMAKLFVFAMCLMLFYMDVFVLDFIK